MTDTKKIHMVTKLRDIELEEACGEYLLAGGFDMMLRAASNEGKDDLVLEMLGEAVVRYKASSAEHLDKATEAEYQRRVLLNG